MYSKKNDSLHCFCCKKFSRKDDKLNSEGLEKRKPFAQGPQGQPGAHYPHGNMEGSGGLAKGLTIDNHRLLRLREKGGVMFALDWWQ